MTEYNDVKLEWIQKASYYDLRKIARFAPLGCSIFTDKILYKEFQTRLLEYEKTLTDEYKVCVSKAIGW